MRTEEKGTKSHYGIANFERRKHPRFNINLPVEYYRTSSSLGDEGGDTGRALNISEGGLCTYFPERIEIGQHLKLKLFFSHDSALITIEPLVEVVWTDMGTSGGLDYYRSGVKFLDISPEDMTKLKKFLNSLCSRDR